MWKAGLVSLVVLANCAAPQEGFDRVGQGGTTQQQIVSAAGIEFGTAQQSAEDQRYNEARDVGFAATSTMAGGGAGLIGGLAGILATPATSRERIPHLLLEVSPSTNIEQYQREIAQSAAPLIGMDAENVRVHFTRQGTFGNQDLFEVAIFGTEQSWSNTSTEAVGVYRSITDQYPSLLSTYVPPLRVNGEWQRPYLYRRGSRLPL